MAKKYANMEKVHRYLVAELRAAGCANCEDVAWVFGFPAAGETHTSTIFLNSRVRQYANAMPTIATMSEGTRRKWLQRAMEITESMAV